MATASRRRRRSKQVKLKEKAEQRKRLDEIKSLALRQGYVTEDQVVWLLDDDDRSRGAGGADGGDPRHAQPDAHRGLRQRGGGAGAREEAAQARGQEAARPPPKAVPQQPVRYDDPVRMYLREMGTRAAAHPRGRGRDRAPHRGRRAPGRVGAVPRRARRCARSARCSRSSRTGQLKIEDFIKVDENAATEQALKKERQRAVKILERVFVLQKRYNEHAGAAGHAHDRASSARTTRPTSPRSRPS